MVELMHRQSIAHGKQHTVGVGGQCGVAEAHEPPDPDALPRQHARHRVRAAVGVLQRLAQVEEPAALGHRGQAALHGGFDGGAHGGVGRQLDSVQFRVATRQVEPADVRRQCGVL